ncbi:MAG TPA: hypothetical protein VGG35_19505 [Streptosporangiaceae bacterium]
MAEAGTLRGVAILQRGTEDIVAVAGGPTRAGPDTGCTLGTRFQIAVVTKQFTAAAVLLLADRAQQRGSQRPRHGRPRPDQDRPPRKRSALTGPGPRSLA